MSSGRRQDLPNKQEQLRTDTAQRLEAIVEAAERAAESVIDDAEKQARRYLDQARTEAERVSASRIGDLSDLVDSLLSQAASLRREAERLQATLEEARGRIDAGAGGAALEGPAPEDFVGEGEAPASDPPRLRAVDGGAQPAGGPDPEARSTDPAGARLLATQLAVSGSSREEIEARLRNRFEIEDTTAILDAILGPEE
jgi:vacuolar-type H+-ATPase subunit H